jgi:hypothetical protein
MRGAMNTYQVSVHVSASRPEDAPGLRKDLRVAAGQGLPNSSAYDSPAAASTGNWRTARETAGRRYAPLLLTEPVRVSY